MLNARADVLSAMMWLLIGGAERLQRLLNSTPSARHYYSDQWVSYTHLGYYPGYHEALSNKSQTYSMEGDNAELRHYVARLARRSRCFTRSIQALQDAIQLFVYAWNRRQLFRRDHPRYSAHVCSIRLPVTLATPSARNSSDLG